MQPWQPMPPLTPQPTAAAPRAGRPTTVTAGAMLLVVAVMLCLAEVAVVTAGLLKQVAHEKQDAGTSSSGAQVFLVAFIMLIAVNVVLASGLMGGALAVLRGRTSGLVLAWIFGGLAVLLRCGCGGTGGYVWYYDATNDGGNDPIPTWLYGADIAIDAVALIAVITAITLLMLGTSRRWLRGAR